MHLNYKPALLHVHRTVVILICILICFVRLTGQDTAIYRGYAGGMLYESIELYPDKTFKRTAEYDMSWSEYGIYTSDYNMLHLYYYLALDSPVTMSLKDTMMLLEKPIRTEHFKVRRDRLYRLDKHGHEIHRIRDKSFRTRWSWLIGHTYEFKRN